MINTRMYRKVRAPSAPAATLPYEVLVGFHFRHVLQEAGSVVELTADEAKYNLLAGRIKPVEAEVEPEAAPVVVKAAVVATPVVTPVVKSAASDTAGGNDSK